LSKIEGVGGGKFSKGSTGSADQSGASAPDCSPAEQRQRGERLMQIKGKQCDSESGAVVVAGLALAGCLELVISFGLARFENRRTRCQAGRVDTTVNTVSVLRDGRDSRDGRLTGTPIVVIADSHDIIRDEASLDGEADNDHESNIAQEKTVMSGIDFAGIRSLLTSQGKN